MGICCGINNEKSDEKGMLNANAIFDFLYKAKKAICEIKMPNGFGSGFFCKIPYTDNNNILLPVLITCSHILKRDSINSKDIKIILNGESKTISLGQRKKWTDQDLDFTCIEIKEKEDNIKTFYTLDDEVLDNNNSIDWYLNKNVLIFAVNKTDGQVGLSNGLIKKCESHYFYYNCNTYPGCSGGCIVNQVNNNVIGIHKGENETDGLNAGIFIREIIKDIKDNKEIVSRVSKYLFYNNFNLLNDVNHYFSYYFIIGNKLLFFLLFYYCM